MAPADSKKKNLDIQFLRAAALLMILVQHGEVFVTSADSWYWTLRRYLDFWGSVDLFFCVSGFIITRGLVQEFGPQQTNTTYLVNHTLGWRRTAFVFWVRRAWRLWPSAWLWILISITCALFFNRSGIFGSPARMANDSLWAWLHLANFHWAGCYMQALSSCNFVPSTQISTHLPTGWNLAVYWSLSLEEQFYFFAPLLFFFLPKRWIAVGILITFLALIPVPRGPLGLAWFVRVDPILVGIAIGWLSCVESAAKVDLRRVWMLRHIWWVRLLGVLMVLGICLLGPQPRGVQPGTVTLIALFSGVLVWIARYDIDVLIPRARWPREFFVWVGARSYCLYLVHMVSYFAAIEIWFRLIGVEVSPWQWARIGTALFMLVVCAELTARKVETPLRRVGHARAKRWLVP